MKNTLIICAKKWYANSPLSTFRKRTKRKETEKWWWKLLKRTFSKDAVERRILKGIFVSNICRQCMEYTKDPSRDRYVSRVSVIETHRASKLFVSPMCNGLKPGFWRVSVIWFPHLSTSQFQVSCELNEYSLQWCWWSTAIWHSNGFKSNANQIGRKLSGRKGVLLKWILIARVFLSSYITVLVRKY